MPYVLFIDESGDHNLSNIDNHFPAFCLAGCIFDRDYYNQVARPSLEDLKKQFWGNSDVILHSSDIRKHRGPFSFLGDKNKREEFYVAIDNLISSLKFTIIAVVILKRAHLEQYGDGARHPYHLSLEFIMERYSLLMKRRARDANGYMMAESRGIKEDTFLKKQYFNCQRYGTHFQSDLSNITSFWMEKKNANIAGLQIADLIAYPIAAKVLRPDCKQRAFDCLAEKIDTAPMNRGGNIFGFGLKIFPQPTLEHYLAFGQTR